MGLLDTFLGGSSGTTAPSSIFAPQADFLEDQFLPQLTQLFKQGQQIDPALTAGRQGALDVAGQLGGQVVDPTQQALMQLFSAPDPSGELVQNAITGATAPLFEQFQNIIAPEIRRSSGAAGQPGGSRGTVATRLAANDLFNKVGDISSQIALNANQQGLNALGTGISAAPGVAGLSLLPSDIQRQVGTEQSNQELDFLNQIKQLLGQPTVIGGGGSTETTPGLSSLFSFNKEL